MPHFTGCRTLKFNPRRWKTCRWLSVAPGATAGHRQLPVLVAPLASASDNSSTVDRQPGNRFSTADLARRMQRNHSGFSNLDHLSQAQSTTHVRTFLLLPFNYL